MDKAKIDKGIMRWAIWPEWITLEISRRVNDAMAKSVKEHPDRLLGLAIVPPWGDEDCLSELDRCINELGMVGVQVESHYGTLYLDAEELRPFFRRINELNVPVIVHHTALPVDYGNVYQYVNMRRAMGRCIDQMISIGRAVYSGMFEELSNLKFIHTMLGGGLYAIKGMLTPKKSRISSDMQRDDPDASDKALGYFERNVFYDITHPPPWGEAQLECAAKVYGADHLLFGTSYPLRSEWAYDGVEYVRKLDISEKDKKLILGENAVRLFKIKK
jgi:predicted TIM-barrel fold metal-dependent hydrolase